MPRANPLSNDESGRSPLAEMGALCIEPSLAEPESHFASLQTCKSQHKMTANRPQVTAGLNTWHWELKNGLEPLYCRDYTHISHECQALCGSCTRDLTNPPFPSTLGPLVNWSNYAKQYSILQQAQQKAGHRVWIVAFVLGGKPVPRHSSGPVFLLSHREPMNQPADQAASTNDRTRGFGGHTLSAVTKRAARRASG